MPIQTAFSGMFNDYKELFKTHYPIASSGGINEATQTFHFANNLIKEIKKRSPRNHTSTSFEVPLKLRGSSRNVRVDGVVVSVDESEKTVEIYYIESKRLLSGSQSNRNNVINDVVKVYRANRKSFRTHSVNICNSREDYHFHEYMICLSDMFLNLGKPGTRKERKEIPYWWCDQSLANRVVGSSQARSLLIPRNTFVDEINASLPSIHWSFNDQYMHRFNGYKMYCPKKPDIKYYCLLCGYTKI